MACNVKKKETSSPAAAAAVAAAPMLAPLWFLPIFETEKAIVKMTLNTWRAKKSSTDLEISSQTAKEKKLSKEKARTLYKHNTAQFAY